MAVQNPLMGALQFENFRACGGLLVVQNPRWELYHFKIFAPAGAIGDKMPLWAPQFENFRACGGRWRCKMPLMGALQFENFRAIGGATS